MSKTWINLNFNIYKLISYTCGRIDNNNNFLLMLYIVDIGGRGSVKRMIISSIADIPTAELCYIQRNLLYTKIQTLYCKHCKILNDKVPSHIDNIILDYI